MGVARVVYEEEPVMYYEPLQHLDEALRQQVTEIVEEKLKLLLKRIQVSKSTIQKKTSAEVGALTDIQTSESEFRKLYNASEARAIQLEASLAQANAELRGIADATGQHCAELVEL